MSVDRVAEVLLAHQRWASRACICGAQVVPLGVAAEARDQAFAAHQAEMLRAEGLVATETEWGVRWPTGQRLGPMSEAEVHAWKSASPVRREVTPWRPA